MKKVFFNIITLLAFTATSAVSANEPCPKESMADMLNNFLGTNKSFEALQKVVAKQAKEENLCEFKLASNPEMENVNPIKIPVQMGYIDSSLNPKDPLSYDRKIIQAIKDFMLSPSCQFEKKDENTLVRKMANGKILEITFRNNSNSDGSYSKEISERNLDFLQNGLEGYHYPVTIGHSRGGKGFDAFPLKSHKASRALPIYSDKFIQKLPSTVKGRPSLLVTAATINREEVPLSRQRKKA